MLTRIERWQEYRNTFSFPKRLIFSFSIHRLYDIRNDFATHYIVGKGYEIGAQNSPLHCKNASKISYIDYLSRKESAQKYNISAEECVDVDIIADANNLDSIPSNSASFIIANHVLEHSPNPIEALHGWLRILKSDGILFLTLPNYKANEFDFEKIPAPITHFIADYKKSKKNEDISSEHIYEHIHIIDGIDPDNRQLTQQRFDEIVASNLHTHYHVFNKKNALEILNYMHRQTPLEIINTFSFENSIELLFIIKKRDPDRHGSFTVKQDPFLNCRILFMQMIKFLTIKTVSYLKLPWIKR